MSNTDTRRLRVFIRVKHTPVTIDIEFSDDHLAKCYYHSIKGSKKLQMGKPCIVRMELPHSAVDLEMSRSLGAIIVHFDSGNNAKRWIDNICRPVQDQPRQVYLKQYWADADFEKLKAALEEKQSQQKRDMVPAETSPLETSPSEIVPSEIVPSEIVPSEIVPSEIVPSEIVPSEIVPSEIVPPEIVPPEILLPRIVPLISLPEPNPSDGKRIKRIMSPPKAAQTSEPWTPIQIISQIRRQPETQSPSKARGNAFFRWFKRRN
ncbi:hypothetical protein CKAH01_11408 [Colletotrichum kahawae]|uniref:Uncharacterized protein n=1 Tax=Colletotrichum kahawae TaxID=34407 RepID=A0AAE0DDS3_COLKA|nr:hypothetical protein CKAH01_11408 [Colletotrichum kahawae]